MIAKPVYWLRTKLAEYADPSRNQGGVVATSMRDSKPMGAWSPLFDNWEPRAVSPYLYEALKEAIPMLDGGLGCLVMLDGILEVEGDNDALVAEITDWMENVPVNDSEVGYQAAYSGWLEELYEQGHGVTEFVLDAKGRDVVGLRVADSKGTAFMRDSDRMRLFYRAPSNAGARRPDGLDGVENLLRGSVRGQVTASALANVGYVELDPRQLVIGLNRPEADNPYGTSMLRSLPFVAQILLRLQNATGRVWERFGDPSYHVSYQAGSRMVDSAEAKRRADAIVRDIGVAMGAKARGNSADIATGVGKEDKIQIEIVGAKGEELEIEMPARHMIEQIVAQFGFPAWMLGVSWAQPSGLGEPQSELVLQSARTRFAKRKAALSRPIEAMLRGRGRRWKNGDWRLVQRLPSLHDEVKRAQAMFLTEQALMMRNGSGRQSGDDSGPRGVDNVLRVYGSQGRKAADPEPEGEPWAESDPALPQIEREAEEGLLDAWRALRDDMLEAVGIDTASAEPFQFDMARLPHLILMGQNAREPMAERLLEQTMAAWERGVANAAEDSAHLIGKAANPNWKVAAITTAVAYKRARRLWERLGAKASWFDDPLIVQAINLVRAAVRTLFATRGLELVRGGLDRRVQERVVSALASGEFDGQNPVNVARELRRRFDAGEYNWERLARSEIGMAQARGKEAMYREAGIDRVDYMTARDELVSDICQHLEAAGPYDLEDAPLPVVDSHPLCRCTWAPAL